MPFIRSRTGDVGALSSRDCRCGLPQPVLKSLDGRSTDAVYRLDGAVVSGLMLTDLLTDLPSVRLSQFVQESEGELDVLLVATDEYSRDVEQEVVRQVRGLMGEGIAVNIRRVPDIPRNPRSGKFQEVICRLPSAVRQPGHRGTARDN